jgi:hypothetical protein
MTGRRVLRVGIHVRSLAPRQVFLLVLALTATLDAFGYWKPRSVFRRAYDNPRAQGASFFGDVRR